MSGDGDVQETDDKFSEGSEEEAYCDEEENVGRALKEGEAPTLACVKYEYYTHCSHVHLLFPKWPPGGDTLQEAFEQAATAMFNYMTTDFSRVEMKFVHEIEAEGEDMMSLLFHFLDEFLFLFSADPCIIARVVKITEFDRENFRIKAEGYGEPFDITKHPQGTEVKAITYSNMQIHDKEDQHELFVIIDI